MYSAALLDHFENPRHAGDLPDANLRVRVENPVCGDILELTALCNAGHLSSIRFRAKGCVPAMACASALCELANQEIKSVGELRKEEILAAVGGVPPASEHAVQLALDALRELVRQAQKHSVASAG